MNILLVLTLTTLLVASCSTTGIYRKSMHKNDTGYMEKKLGRGVINSSMLILVMLRWMPYRHFSIEEQVKFVRVKNIILKT